MADKLSTEPYKGVRDFYPADWARMQAMFANIRGALARAGYEEYQASPLERAELYEAKTSEEIVNEQTYTFTDRGDRRVTLRPEMTPTLARMIAGKRREIPFPARWFSIGNRFRYERPQKGRLREFYQADIDLVGASEGEADIEVVTIASQILRSFGANESDFVVRMNSRPLLNAACAAAGLKGDAVKQYLHLLDRKAKMPPEEFAAAASALAHEDPLAIINDAGSSPEVAAEKKKLLDRINALSSRGVGNVVFDPSITRGFDYYTGMVFEFFDTNPENPRSLFGGDPIPAVGFALGDVTLSDFLDTHGLAPKITDAAPQLYLGTPQAGDIPAAQAFAQALREKSCRVFVNLSDKSLGDQIKDAVRRGIPLFAAYGANEVANNALRLKVLATGSEEAMALTEVPARLAAERA